MSTTTKPLPPIRACLFDMDGLLIDSEDLYTICTNEVLHKFGKPDLPWSIKAQMQGRPGPEAGLIFQQWANLPIDRTEMQTLVTASQKRNFPNTKFLPGVPLLLSTLSSSPNLHLALATSSNKHSFKLKTDHLAAGMSVFEDRHRVLGDDERIPPGKGKPSPEIYLLALETINSRIREEAGDHDRAAEILPSECLVFEDSVPGVEAGRRAGMQVVWCPHPGLLNEYKGREEAVLAGVSIMEDYGVSSGGEGAPGIRGDGWARLYGSLEDFPYADYGITTV